MSSEHERDLEGGNIQIFASSDPELGKGGEHFDSITRITTHGPNDDYIKLGDHTYHRSELQQAFGGSLNPALHVKSKRRFINPAPLGMSGFACPTFLLSLINIGARGVHTPNVAVGLGMFYGGFIQFISGMWCIVVEEEFAGTVLSAYAAFWLGFGSIFIDFFGIQKAYSDPQELRNGIGLMMMAWAIFTIIVVTLTIRSTVSLCAMFSCLLMMILLLGAANFTNSPTLQKAGGYFGVFTSLLAWYNCFAGLASKENCYFVVKPIFMPGAQKIK